MRIISQVKKAYQLSKGAYSAFKKQILILIFLGFFGGLLEGIGINALIPLLSIATGTQWEGDFISDKIELLFSFIGIDVTLRYLLIFITLLFIGKALVSLYLNYVRIKIGATYEEATRRELFKQTFSAKWPYLLDQKLGSLESILLIDIQKGAVLLQKMASITIEATTLIVYALIALNISYRITLVALTLGIALFFIFKPFLDRSRLEARKMRSLNATMSHTVGEHLLGMKSIKASHSESAVTEKGNILFEVFKKARIRFGVLNSLTTTIIEPIGVIFISVIFAISYTSLDFNFAAFVAVIYLIQRIFLY